MHLFEQHAPADMDAAAAQIPARVRQKRLVRRVYESG